MRLLWSILLFSSVITLIGTAVQLYLDYQRDLSDVDKQIDNIQVGHLESLTTSFWKIDTNQIGTELKNMVKMRDVLSLTIYTDDWVEYRVGENPKADEDVRIHRFPMMYDDDGVIHHIGDLEVTVSLSGVRDRLFDRVLTILVTQATKTFMVSIFILGIFHFLVARHLTVMAAYTRKLSVDTMEEPLMLTNRKIDPQAQDEIDEVVSSINTMRINLKGDVERRIQAERSLEESEIRLKSLVNTVPDLVWLKDQDGVYLACNRRFEEFFGAREAEILGKTDHDFVDSELADFFRAKDRVVMESGRPNTNEEWITFASDGHHELLETIKAPLFNEQGEMVGVLGVGRNITQRKLAEERIRVLSQALEQSPVSVMITDVKGDIEYVNSTFERTSGYTEREVIGRNVTLLKSGHTPRGIYKEMWDQLEAGESWRGELENRHKSGEFFWERVHIAPVEDDKGVVHHYLAVKEDITQQRQQEEQILHQAHYDTLTDLPNRFLALDRLKQMILETKRSGNWIAVMFIDLDNFKKINDTLGHESGDTLLVQAAKRLSEAVRGGDTVGRLGGDEFIVLLSGLKEPSDAGSVAESLIELFRESFRLDGRELILTASIGIAVYPEDGSNPQDLLRNADTAMYHSKERGRNAFHFFNSSMNENAERRLVLEEQLNGALGRNEFRLLYQPLVDIKSRQVLGAEVLLRWDNPALGEISPLEFIPIAEQTGMIIPIGEFVLREAVKQLSHWQEKYRKDFRLAINISPRQFRDPSLTECIESTLQQAGISGESIGFEITEGVLMSGQADVDTALTRLHQLGVGIVMDDFGTGYSSLSYLRRYPFDALKIDRSFIQDITEDLADLELVNATIVMAHGLGLEVVAEGVENEQQLECLVELGCDLAQGYYFSRPVPAGQISRMLSWNQSQLA